MKRLPFLLCLVSLLSFLGILLDRRDDRLLRAAAGESESERTRR